MQLPFEYLIQEVNLALEVLDLGTDTADQLPHLSFSVGEFDGSNSRLATGYFGQHFDVSASTTASPGNWTRIR